MRIKPVQEKVLLGSLVFITLLGIMVLNTGMSGYVIGVPSSCKSQINVEAPGSIEVYQGETTSYDVKVYNVSCGVSNVNMAPYGLEENWYDISPTRVATIAPGQEKTFRVYLDVPLNAEIKTYSTPYKFSTNEGQFIVGETEIEVVEPEKPKAEPNIQVSTEEVEISKKKEIPFSENAKFWYGVALIASVLAIAVIGSTFFKDVERKREAMKRKPDSELPKAMGKKPEKKENFEKVIKEEKK